jgi:hypothetical protein
LTAGCVALGIFASFDATGAVPGGTSFVFVCSAAVTTPRAADADDADSAAIAPDAGATTSRPTSATVDARTTRERRTLIEFPV